MLFCVPWPVASLSVAYRPPEVVPQVLLDAALAEEGTVALLTAIGLHVGPAQQLVGGVGEG